MLTKDQFNHLLLSRDVEDRLERLRENGTLCLIFPEVHAMVGFGGGTTGHKDLWAHTKKVVAQCVRRPAVRWAALFHDVGKVKCFTRAANGEISFHGHESVSAKLFMRAAARTRLFTSEEADWIRFVIHNLGYVEEYDSTWTDSAVRRIHRAVSRHFEDLVDLARADVTTMHDNKRAKHHERVSEFHRRALEIAAKDAIPPALPKGLGDVLSSEFGIPKTEALGKLMTALKAAVEAGELERQPSVEAVLAYVREKGLV